MFSYYTIVHEAQNAQPMNSFLVNYLVSPLVNLYHNKKNYKRIMII